MADINDFINPEQECIIQTGSNVKLDNDFLMDDDIGMVKLKNKKRKNNDFGHFDQIVTDKLTNTAKITLDDCLACSGCITSAETVLIKQQSTQEMESYLTTHKNVSLIVTISNQAFIAIANKYNMDIQIAKQKISAFFKQEYNAKYVFDTSVALEIVLKEAIHQFITNYAQNFIIQDEADSNDHESKNNHNDNNNGNGMEIDSLQEEEKKQENSNTECNNIRLPILSSECPGFVCYAEKSCKSTVLEYMSSLKSQQIMGC